VTYLDCPEVFQDGFRTSLRTWSQTLTARDVTGMTLPALRLSQDIWSQKGRLKKIGSELDVSLALYVATILYGMVDDFTQVDFVLHRKERTLTITFFLPKTEFGKVIGKNGSVISSLRRIAQSAAAPRNRTVMIDIEEAK